MASQSEIQLMLDLKIRGEQEVTSDFARVANEMARVAEKAFEPIAESFAAAITKGMKGAIDQQSASGIITGGGRGGIVTSSSPPGAGMPAPEGSSSRAFRVESTPATGMAHMGVSPQGGQIAETANRMAMQPLESMGAYARARRQASSAGVQMEDLTETEIGAFNDILRDGREKLSQTVASIGELALKLKEAEAKGDLTAAADLRSKITAGGAFVRQASADVNNINAVLPGEEPGIAWGKAAGYAGAAAHLLGGVPVAVARTQADIAAMQEMTARAALGNDMERVLAIQRQGGQGTLSAEGAGIAGMGVLGQTLVGAGSGAAVGGALGLIGGPLAGVTAATGAVVGGLIGLTRGLMGFSAAARKAADDLVEAQLDMQAPEMAVLRAGRGQAIGAYGAARGQGMASASGLIAGDEGMLLSAANMGFSPDEYSQRAAQIAGAMGVNAGGGARAGTAGGRNSIGRVLGMEAGGMSGASDVFSQLWQGGMRGGQGSEAADAMERAMSAAVAAGFDRSKVGPAILYALQQQGGGIGSAGAVMDRVSRDLASARATFGAGVGLGGPEMQTMQTINKTFEDFAKSPTGLGKIAGIPAEQMAAGRLGGLRGFRGQLSFGEQLALQTTDPTRSGLQAIAEAHHAHMTNKEADKLVSDMLEARRQSVYQLDKQFFGGQGILPQLIAGQSTLTGAEAAMGAKIPGGREPAGGPTRGGMPQDQAVAQARLDALRLAGGLSNLKTSVDATKTAFDALNVTIGKIGKAPPAPAHPASPGYTMGTHFAPPAHN